MPRLERTLGEPRFDGRWGRGRHPELAVLAGAVDEMLAGEPGIGTTRMAHELTDLALATGHPELLGDYGSQSTPPG